MTTKEELKKEIEKLIEENDKIWYQRLSEHEVYWKGKFADWLSEWLNGEQVND